MGTKHFFFGPSLTVFLIQEEILWHMLLDRKIPQEFPEKTIAYRCVRFFIFIWHLLTQLIMLSLNVNFKKSAQLRKKQQQQQQQQTNQPSKQTTLNNSIPYKGVLGNISCSAQWLVNYFLIRKVTRTRHSFTRTKAVSEAEIGYILSLLGHEEGRSWAFVKVIVSVTKM